MLFVRAAIRQGTGFAVRNRKGTTHSLRFGESLTPFFKLICISTDIEIHSIKGTVLSRVLWTLQSSLEQ